MYYDFINSVRPILIAIRDWINSLCALIINNPLLLWTSGFVMLGCAIIIFGKMLSR